jgi:hypothetical protein
MKLADGDVSVTLSVAGYEFPTGHRWPDLDWDDVNWLQIQGTILTGDRSWAFHAPCLLTSEALSIAEWLEEVAQGRVQPLRDIDLEALRGNDLDHTWEDDALTFLEPTLAFSVQETDDPHVLVRVHLAHEAADPDLPEDDKLADPPPFVRVRTTRENLSRAAHDWRKELRAWPIRKAARD